MLNRINITLIILMLTASIAIAQETILKGHISDKHGNSLFAVNIYLQNHNSIGAISDLDGNFTLRLPNFAELKGDYVICSFIGYNPSKYPIDSINLNTPLNVVLLDNTQTINEVVVKGRKSISKEFSIKELDKLKIYLSPLSSADPLKALAMLPSSTNTNETANPELRGSSSNRTKVFLNGVPVSNPVRNSQLNGIGFFSLFNTEMIKNEFIYPSNPPLIYGNTSAGLIDIETEDKLQNNKYNLSMTLASSGVSISQKMGSKNFIQLYSNLMYSDRFLAVNPLISKRLKGFNSSDFGVNFHCTISENISFNLYNYLLSESSSYCMNLFTWEDNADAKTVRNFSILNLKYQKKKEIISLNVGTNFSKSTFEFGNIKSSSANNQIYASLNYKHIFTDRFSVQTGFSNDYEKSSFDDKYPLFYYALSPTSPFNHTDTNITLKLPESYLYFRWNPIRKVILGAGVRKNLRWNTGNNFMSIQGSLRYNFKSDNSLLFSMGQYHNYSEPNYGQKEFRLLSSNHFAVEYIYEKNNTTLNLAAYYKTEIGDTDGTRIIKGTEVYIQKNLGKYFVASISNTVLNSDISFQNKEFSADNSVGYFLTTTLSYFNSRLINASASWSNRPGKYYTPVVSSTFNPIANAYEPTYSNSSNSNRFGSYNTINLSLSKMIAFRKNSLIVFASINNLLNNRNQKGLNYSTNYSNSSYEYYQQRTIYFGCMVSIN